MSTTIRVLIVLACAYAGWETANLQLEQLPEPTAITQVSQSQ